MVFRFLLALGLLLFFVFFFFSPAFTGVSSLSTHSCLFTAKDLPFVAVTLGREKWRPGDSAQASRFKQDTPSANSI